MTSIRPNVSGREQNIGARRLRNEASFKNQSPLSAMLTMKPFLNLSVQCCTTRQTEALTNLS